MTGFPSLKDIFNNPDVAAALLFCVTAVGGQVLHAIKKWGDGEVECIADWFRTGIRGTVSAMIANVAGMLLFVQTGILTAIYQAQHGWWALILFGFMNGFTSDSGLNKGIRKVWTPEERAAKNAQPPTNS